MHTISYNILQDPHFYGQPSPARLRALKGTYRAGGPGLAIRADQYSDLGPGHVQELFPEVAVVVKHTATPKWQCPLGNWNQGLEPAVCILVV